MNNEGGVAPQRIVKILQLSLRQMTCKEQSAAEQVRMSRPFSFAIANISHCLWQYIELLLQYIEHQRCISCSACTAFIFGCGCPALHIANGNISYPKDISSRSDFICRQADFIARLCLAHHPPSAGEPVETTVSSPLTRSCDQMRMW